MNIIDKLDAKRERNRTSTRALARACGATVYSLKEDMEQPDPDLVEFPPGTVACCNRCSELHPLPEPVEGRRVGDRAYRLVGMCILACGHLDSHWVYLDKEVQQ